MRAYRWNGSVNLAVHSQLRFLLLQVRDPDDRMIPSIPFEGPLQLTARLDGDGDALSRKTGDLQGSADGSFSPGARGVSIILDEIL